MLRSCLAASAYLAFFAAIDALLENRVETAYQMLIRLMVVSTGVMSAILLVLSLAQWVRAAQEETRLAHEQTEHQIQAAKEEAARGLTRHVRGRAR